MTSLDDTTGDDLAEGAGAAAPADGAGAAEHRRMRRSTLVFAAATMLSRIAGLAREIATAALFGTSTVYSAFVIANQIPNLLRSLVADSALSAAFVPVFTELREHDERERAWRLAGAVCAVIIAVLGPLTVLAMVLAPWIVAPFLGSSFAPADVQLVVDLTRLLMPIVLVLALSGVVVGILNAHDRFGAAALAPVAWNAVILMSLAIAAVTLDDVVDQVWLYAIGMVCGTVVQAMLPAPWLRGLGGRVRLRSTWRDPKLREVFVLMLPVTISLGMINLQQLIASGFAAHVDAADALARLQLMPTGGIEPGAGPAVLDKAFRIYMLPQGIFSVAVSTVFFPVLARLAARADTAGFRDTVDAGLRQILILLVPSSVFLAALALPVTRALYEYRAFDEHESVAVAAVLLAFALGLTFNGMALLLVRSLFSMKATWVPTWASAATLALNVLLNLLAYEQWGVIGIALATSLANVANVVLLYRALARRTGGLGTARTAAIGAGTLACALVAVGVGAAAYLGWTALLGTGSVATIGGVAAALAVAAPIYLTLGPRVGVVPRGLVSGLLRRG